MVGILFSDACLCLTETRLGCGLCDCQFYTQCSSLSHPDIPVFVTRVVQCTVEQPSTAQYSLLRQRQAQISWSVSRAEQPDTSLDTDPRQPAPPLNTSLAFLDSDPPTKMGLKQVSWLVKKSWRWWSAHTCPHIGLDHDFCSVNYSPLISHTSGPAQAHLGLAWLVL